jgi:predicted nucleic acid-binding protein
VNHVFLDTVGLLAIWDETDQWHDLAVAAFSKLRQSGSVCVTTTFVLLECGNAAARRPYRSTVGRLRDEAEAAGSLIRPTDEDWIAAWDAYSRGFGGAAGIVDQVSFIIMRRLTIQQAFTHNSHFSAAGFETLF